MTQRALVTGATGQDGYYLTMELDRQGWDVACLYRGRDDPTTSSGINLFANSTLASHSTWFRGDLTDAASIASVVDRYKPHAVFNLGALSYVGNSWNTPGLYMETNTQGVINVLEAVKRHAPSAHVVQASSSEMYGTSSYRLDEQSPMYPASPYGVSKLAAHRMCKVYRDSYGMRVSCAISFNHESPRRPPAFVTRKITQQVAQDGKVVLSGDPLSQRDWGFAGDYVKAYILMAEQEKGDDFVIATGETHSVAEFAEEAFAAADKPIDLRTTMKSDRPNDLLCLKANPRKAEMKLGWKAETSFKALVRMMVEADLAKALVPA